MNVGLLEARDLAQTVCDVIEGRGGSESLAAYETARRAEWDFLLGLDRRVNVPPGVDSRIAGLVPGVESLLPASGGDLEALLGQLGLAVPA
jgi:2-polyprenyl-6-methoxyphenol hydroxylase-like FAD-dependent oxidoreductase